MKQIKVEWCENFVRSKFKKLPFPNGGIEVSCFFKMAQDAGLYQLGTYGSPMSRALEELTQVGSIHDDEGNFLYNIFKLK
ncbi:MAG: hypothetical protein HPZ79_04620 [Oscillospiraceae bacterium]|nr:hypothetical protein [Oscillospiraceae bacterium]